MSQAMLLIWGRYVGINEASKLGLIALGGSWLEPVWKKGLWGCLKLDKDLLMSRLKVGRPRVKATLGKSLLESVQ